MKEYTVSELLLMPQITESEFSEIEHFLTITENIRILQDYKNKWIVAIRDNNNNLYCYCYAETKEAAYYCYYNLNKETLNNIDLSKLNKIIKVKSKSGKNVFKVTT